MDKTNRTEETSEVAKTDNKTPRTDELSEEARAVTKDFAAHDNKKSGALCLAGYTAKALDNTLQMGAVGKLPTDAESNNAPYKKAKLDYGIGSISMRVIEDKDVGTTKEHRLVAKTLSMGPELDNCSVSHRGLRVGRLTCRTTCRTRQQSTRRCRRNRRRRHQAGLSARARALRAHLRTGEGYASTAYLIACTAQLRGHHAAYRICGTPPTAPAHKARSCKGQGGLAHLDLSQMARFSPES